MRIILASASSARTRLLTDAGIRHDIIVSGVDEDAVVARNGWLTAFDVAGGLATEKARDVATRIRGNALVIGCDSVFDIHGEIHGKPASPAEARARWNHMRGSHGVLYTGHHIIDTGSGQEVARVASSTVFFADPSDAEIDAYIATGEPLRVAGGVTIDGLGAPFISRIDGDHSNVMGLSIPTLRLMLMELDLHWPQLWSTDQS